MKIRSTRALALFATAILLVSQVASAQVDAPDRAAGSELQGRIEVHEDGFRVVRVWGNPRERGFAHGMLLAADIVPAVRAEYRYRFRSQPHLLQVGRASLPRLITYPEPVRAELEALFEGIEASGLDLALADFDRDLDLQDLLFLNALDVFATMACSGFTAWGEQVERGGVLTTRNFDWPYSGKHMTDGTIVLVQEPDTGRAFASVTLPGYVGVVTGVSEDGVAVFLHVGSGDKGLPEPDSMPTATAAREILQFAPRGGRVEFARRVLDETSPPSSYLVRVVMPDTPVGMDAPVAIFETDIRSVTLRERAVPCVVTNHFFAHESRGDSGRRYRKIFGEVEGRLANEDKKVSVREAWQAMQAVERGGRRFASLHSLVFRHEPWVFELRVGTAGDDGVVTGAPSSNRRFGPSREMVFGASAEREAKK